MTTRRILVILSVLFVVGWPCAGWAATPGAARCRKGGKNCPPSQTCGDGHLDAGEECDDDNQASGDCCSPTCQFEKGACDDGLFCTTNDHCRRGECQGSRRSCDDRNPCTSDACSGQTNRCEHVALADGNNCSDGDLCNGTETCQGGICGGAGIPLDCDDHDPCTADSCDVGTGCVHQPVSPTAACVVVAVEATDPNAAPLHYRWRVSEGSIDDVDAARTAWHLPGGPGVHFANVLVSNGRGGHTERRLVVVSDTLGFPAPSPQPRSFASPANVGRLVDSDLEYVVTDNLVADRLVYLPDVQATYHDDANATDVVTTSNLRGGLPFYNGSHCDDGFCDDVALLFISTHPHTHTVPGDHVLGSVALGDGSPCGTENFFQDVQSGATAVLLDAAGVPVGAPVRVNAFGDYALPFDARAVAVRVACEAAAPVTVTFDASSHLAPNVVFAGTGAPSVTDMNARYLGQPIGAFLPPELGAPSDRYPSSSTFLAFKGLDSRQGACEYYRTLGAVQSCDASGNPTGAITFDDWKRQVGMAPYLRAGGQEATATYINRIDLNLTRRHHAIAYDEPTPPVAEAIVGGSHTCERTTDGKLLCWGDDPFGEVRGPNDDPGNVVGGFQQVDVGFNTTCGLRSDGRVACWGDDNVGNVSGPNGDAGNVPGAFDQVSLGAFHTCALKTDGRLVCWGYDANGQTSGPNLDPGNVAGAYVQVSAGEVQTCAVTVDHRIVCWGDDTPNQDPGNVPGAFVQVSAGMGYTCGLKTDGRIVCWGPPLPEVTGPNGDAGNVPGAYVRVRVTRGTFVEGNTCAVRTDGRLACWGNDSLGQVSGPTAASDNLPGTYVDVSVAGDSTCALRTDGRVVCWGDNSFGQTTLPGQLTAAYVCNHLGPASDTQADVDAAIDNAVAGRNLVACVAMDYQLRPSAAAPQVRYFTFLANGALALSINLDGRREKFMPGVCVACHGGDRYDGAYPTDGRGSPDVGAHFLPYDVGNFAFSTQPGLTKAAQQAAIHRLNDLVLRTNTTDLARRMLRAWYASGTDVLDEGYWPPDWQAAVGTLPGVDVERLYKEVNARYCRTCHVALTRGTHITNNPEVLESWSDATFRETVCGGSPQIDRNHTMPNSLVTFNRLWADANAQAVLATMLPGPCLDVPDPSLQPAVPPIALSTGVPLSGVGGAAGSVTRYSIAVPASATGLDVTLAGGSGQVFPQLFAGPRGSSGSAVGNCNPVGAGWSCSATTPGVDTTYYIILYGDTAYAGYALTATYQLPSATGHLRGGRRRS